MGRNSGPEVGGKVRPALRTPSLLLSAALETRQAEDVLAGQDSRLLDLRQAHRAGSARPSQRTPQSHYATGGPNITTSRSILLSNETPNAFCKGRSRPQLLADTLVVKPIEDPDQLLQCVHAPHVRGRLHQLLADEGKTGLKTRLVSTRSSLLVLLVVSLKETRTNQEDTQGP